MTRILIPFLILFLDVSAALRLPVRGQVGRRSYLKRQDNSKVVKLDDQGNVNYLANITMGGETFEVTIDTGSSDLWVQKPVPNAQLTQFQASVTYAVGQISGPIKLADTTFSGFTVKNQAYIEVPPGGNQDAGDSDGLIGLGPSAGSQVQQAAGNKVGMTFLDNTFRQDTTSPNIITALLSREGDAGTNVQGEFSVGAIPSGFDQINSQPKLPIVHVPVNAESNQHWTSLVDGIIGPDGQRMNLRSTVPNTPSGKLVAVYDTGFTFPQVPKTVADAIYSGIPGATFDNSQGGYVIPCEQEVNLTFIIGGQNYSIHPFDTGMQNVLPGGGNKDCLGAFQPIATGTADLFDMIMGMAALRNMLMLVNFGDFVDGNPENQGDPFMQLLSTTDPAKAHREFVQSRLGGVDTTGSQSRPITSTNFDNADPNSDDENKVKAFFTKNWPYFAAGGGALAAIILLGCVFSSVRRRRRANYTSSVYPIAASTNSYKPLHDHTAPGGAMGTYGGGYATAPVQSYQPYHASGYGDGGRGYVDPYGSRY